MLDRMRPLLLLLVCTATCLAHAASNFTFSNPEGPYGVGLRVVHQYDYSRAYKGKVDLATGKPSSGERARPLQTLIWYPAAREGKRLVYGDYLRTVATEEVFDRTEAEIDALTRDFVAARGSDLSAEQLQEELVRPMWAVREAPPTQGRFPVVIYAPSFNASASENADLCEYLASQGYVVLASPNMGARSRPMTGDLEGAETQVGDIEFLIGHAHSLPQADLTRLAVVGFSWGGMSNVFAAARDSRIKALVSLDGSVRYFPDLVGEARYATPERLAIPFLYVSAQPPKVRAPRKAGKTPPNGLIDAMKYSDVYLVTMSQLIHSHFSSTNLRFMPEEAFSEASREDVSRAHSWVVRDVHRFLDAYLKDDAASRAQLSHPAADDGVPLPPLSIDVRHAVGVPQTRETMAAELARRGFEHAPEVYQAMQQQDARFKLSESDLLVWGYELLRQSESRAAIELFKLARTLHPDGVKPLISLAEAYEKTRETPLALENYRQILVKDPKNAHALRHLKLLEAAKASPAGN